MFHLLLAANRPFTFHLNVQALATTTTAATARCSRQLAKRQNANFAQTCNNDVLRRGWGDVDRIAGALQQPLKAENLTNYMRNYAVK